MSIEFHPLMISDDSLNHLRRLITLKGFDMSPRLAEWIIAWAGEEAAARAEGSTSRRTKHAIALPPTNTWTDSQLADALEMSTTLSYCPGLPGDLSQFVDRIAQATVGIVADRLRQKSTP